MLCFARLKASSGPRTKWVPTNNQMGRVSGSCNIWGGLNKSRHIVPSALFVRVQCFRNDLYKVVQGPSTRYRPVDHWVILSTSNEFDCFGTRQDEIRFALIFSYWQILPGIEKFRHHVPRLSEPIPTWRLENKSGIVPIPSSSWCSGNTHSILGKAVWHRTYIQLWNQWRCCASSPNYRYKCISVILIWLDSFSLN